MGQHHQAVRFKQWAPGGLACHHCRLHAAGLQAAGACGISGGAPRHARLPLKACLRPTSPDSQPPPPPAAAAATLQSLDGLEQLTAIRFLYLDNNCLPESELLRLPGACCVPPRCRLASGGTARLLLALLLHRLAPCLLRRFRA